MESNHFCVNINIESINPILRDILKITKELFFSTTEFNFENFISDVNQYIRMNPLNEETIQNILGIYSIVRPHKHELLTKIEKTISITCSSAEEAFKKIFTTDLPLFFKIVELSAPVIEIIKNDDFFKFQELISNIVDFDFNQEFHISNIQNSNDTVNLLDIASYYGSVECFKYLVLNDAQFSKNVCAFAICGGNNEIKVLSFFSYYEVLSHTKNNLNFS